MSSDQALSLWKSQLTSYERIITRCCNRILTPLTRFLPPDFQDRIQQLKQLLESRDIQNYLDFTDVIVHFIEGVKNKSIIQVADLLMQELGGTLRIWQNAVADLAEQINYTNELSIWHVRKQFQERLYIDAVDLSNYRQLCKVTKNYLSALINLVKYVKNFNQNKDTLVKIDELFKKVKKAQQKYVGLSEQINGFEHSSTIQEMSNNLSMRSKQQAMKQLFNFTQPQKVEKIQRNNNTLFRYNFKFKNKNGSERVSEPTKNIRETCKALSGSKLESFEKVLKNVKIGSQNINDLRDQFFGVPNQAQIPSNTNQVNLTTIWDKDYYFSYVAFPINMNQFNQFTRPFQRHLDINYEIHSEDQYQELIGEDVQVQSQMSSVSELSKNSFVVSDDHFSEDEDAENMKKQVKGKNDNLNGFGEKWSFNRIDGMASKVTVDFSLYTMVCLENKSKLPLPTQSKTQIQQFLCKIVHGKDRQAIQQCLSKQKNFKPSKAKLKQFLEKKCRLVENPQSPNKPIYKIIEYENEENEQTTEVSELNSSAQNQLKGFKPNSKDDSVVISSNQAKEQEKEQIIIEDERKQNNQETNIFIGPVGDCFSQTITSNRIITRQQRKKMQVNSLNMPNNNSNQNPMSQTVTLEVGTRRRFTKSLQKTNVA